MSNREKISLSEMWLKFHPYNNMNPSDYYFLDLCKQVRKMFDKQGNQYFSEVFDDYELTELSCMLVCYFEDVISQCGIWQAFRKLHYEKYQKYLPFYELNGYEPEEINYDDICFLLWYYQSMKTKGKRIYSPLNTVYIRVAMEVFNLFDIEFETAPENSKLYAFIKQLPKDPDFYEVRYKIQWLVNSCYLFFYAGETVVDELQEFIEENGIDHVSDFSKELNDGLTFNRHLDLMALRACEWYAHILTKEHPLFVHILNISEKKSGKFFMQMEDTRNLYFQHIASDTVIAVTKKSLERIKGTVENETIFHIGFIKWRNEWWFTGSLIAEPFNADLVLDEKNNIKSRSLFGNTHENSKYLLEQYKMFLKFNKKNALAFLSKKQTIESFMNNFVEFHKTELNITPEKEEQSKKRLRKDGFFGPDNNELKFESESYTPKMIWFNPKSGPEVIFGFNNFINDKENKDYDPNFDSQTGIQLIAHPHISADFVFFLIESYHLQNVKFGNEQTEDHTAMDNLDFLLRFYKNENYHTFQNITLI